MGYLSCNAESAIATCDPYICERKKKEKHRNCQPNHKIREFSYSELESATDGFSVQSFLGKGSHGSVYKAVLDQGKLIAAVKRTTISKAPAFSCNNCITTPAENEIEILSRIGNGRLVNLLGFCAELTEKKLIVVEYMPNGSLYDHLHSSLKPPGLTRRIRFALQIAKAVEYLHSCNPPVIHRDIKSSNVLIDQYLNARLGDFGLALRGHVEDVKVSCTPPAGTLGYLDPSYLAPGDLSPKSDVFSFGILLLEIISGRNAIDVNYSPPSVVDWAVPLIIHGEYDEVLDRRIRKPEDTAVIRQLTVLAARCVRMNAENRPPMAEVVGCLGVVSKRAHAPIWNHLRRRVRCVENSASLAVEVLDGSEEMVKSTKLGSRKNRNISSVSGEKEVVCTRGSKPVVASRSKSIGSVSEIAVVRRKHDLAVKLPVVSLGKSRSMGVLQSTRLHVQGKERGGYVFKLMKKPNLGEMNDSKWLVSLEKQTIEGTRGSA